MQFPTCVSPRHLLPVCYFLIFVYLDLLVYIYIYIYIYIILRFPGFQVALKIDDQMLGMSCPWKLRRPEISSIAPEDMLSLRDLYTNEHHAEFDASAASRGSRFRAAGMSYCTDWLSATAADGPRSRIVLCNSSIEGGCRVVEYCTNNMACYGTVISIHEHVTFRTQLQRVQCSSGSNPGPWFVETFFRAPSPKMVQC